MDGIFTAIDEAVASGTASVGTAVSTNYWPALAIGVGIFAGLLIWRIARRLIGGR